MFRDWIFRNFQLAPRDNAVAVQITEEMGDYAQQVMEQRLDDPQDDLLTSIAHAEIDGEPVDWELKRGYVMLMILAGIDTTWSAIGSGLWHFAQHADERATPGRRRRRRHAVATGVEEVLRYYAPVTMGRKVIEDTEVAGCPVRSRRPDARHVPRRQSRSGRVRGRPRVPARPGARTGTSRSASASTAVSARTWRASR